MKPEKVLAFLKDCLEGFTLTVIASWQRAFTDTPSGASTWTRSAGIPIWGNVKVTSGTKPKKAKTRKDS